MTTPAEPEQPAKKPYRRHTQTFKDEAVALAAELGNIHEAAQRLGIGDTLLRTWRAKQRLGKTAEVLEELPTTHIGLRQKAKEVIPVSFKCPHCGGPILLPGGNHVQG